MAGIDVGATLAKVAVRGPDGSSRYHLEPSAALEAVAGIVAESGATQVGVTGGGAAELAGRLAEDPVRVNEFAAWGRGAADLLASEGVAPDERQLLVAVGTGTSILLADGLAVTRIGGTALGGGTVMGLAALLLGDVSFDRLAELATRGQRQAVDLRVRDIYRSGEFPLLGDITAANFGKLAGLAPDGPRPAREDLAQALMGLVGENVALVCAGLCAAHQVRRVAFGGSTLRGNPALVEILRTITSALGCDVHFLPHGEFAGAVGALLLAQE